MKEEGEKKTDISNVASPLALPFLHPLHRTPHIGRRHIGRPPPPLDAPFDAPLIGSPASMLRAGGKGPQRDPMTRSSLMTNGAALNRSPAAHVLLRTRKEGRKEEGYI